MLAAGAKRKQLNQGTPFYGYWYKTVSSVYGACPEAATSSDGTCGDDVVTSLDYGSGVLPLLASGEWQVYRDPEGLVPYLLRKDGKPGFVTYDDPLSTYDRVLYSDWVQHLGGTFMWALELGYTGTDQPLLKAMHAATRGKLLS
jgi:GH18 family chitinase